MISTEPKDLVLIDCCSDFSSRVSEPYVLKRNHS